MEVLDLAVGDPPKPGILDILKNIRPSWESDNIVIKDLLGGNLNTLYYCGLAEDTDESDVVIIKLYGGTTGWIDRDKEVINIRAAHGVGLAAPLYSRFKNGLAYKYNRGDIVNSATVAKDSFTRRMAKTLATLHHIDYEKAISDSGYSKKVDQTPLVYNTPTIMKGMVAGVPDSYDDPLKENIRQTEFRSNEDTLAEIERYCEEIKEMNLSTCFCHNDANPSNTIYDAKTGAITLIDWEMCGIDFAAFEIGWYFAARVMTDNCAEDSLKFYPDQASQLKWIRWYVEYSAELQGKDPKTVAEAEINTLFKGAVVSALMRTLTAVVHFRKDDHQFPAHKDSFRRARHFQKLFWLINELYHAL